MQPLTKEYRRAVCVHEAGHAIIHALGGDFIYRVAVAPEGATDWQVEGRKGGILTDLWGVCSPSDLGMVTIFMKWDEDEWAYRTDRTRFNDVYKGLERQLREQGKRPGVLAHQRNALRRHLFGALAGPIAEALHMGEDSHDATYPDGWHDEGHDISKAIAYASLLPWRNEYEHAQELTEQTLLRPDVWAMVLRLADELERVGNIEDGIDAYLPAPVPNWPPSPRARQNRPFEVRPFEYA